MENVKHTHGPWFVGENSKGECLVFAKDEDRAPWQICKLFENASHTMEPIMDNAALISAAPELLEALQAIISQDRVIVAAKESGPLSVLNDILNDCRAAIAKATNTEPK